MANVTEELRATLNTLNEDFKARSQSLGERLEAFQKRLRVLEDNDAMERFNAKFRSVLGEMVAHSDRLVLQNVDETGDLHRGAHTAFRGRCETPNGRITFVVEVTRP